MPTFQIYRDATGLYRWRLRAANRRIIADSAESYQNEADCRAAIALIQQHAATATVTKEAQRGKRAAPRPLPLGRRPRFHHASGGAAGAVVLGQRAAGA